MVRRGQVGRRIHVCGTSGSGKTTLGKALSEKLDLPFVELDSIYHGPNWTEMPVDEFQARVRELTAGEAWVIDGNYSKVKEIVDGRADTYIWLDYPFPVIFWRMTRRVFGRCLRRTELWNGNRERLFVHLFTRDSLFWWIMTTYRRRRRECDEQQAQSEREGKAFFRFQKPSDARALLDELP